MGSYARHFKDAADVISALGERYDVPVAKEKPARQSVPRSSVPSGKHREWLRTRRPNLFVRVPKNGAAIQRSMRSSAMLSAMRLWSWQTPDVSLCEGQVHPMKGEFWEDLPTLRTAYQLLWDLLQTRDIIWCYTSRPSFFLRPGRRMVAWVIEATDDGILRFVDGQKWEEYVHGRSDPRTSEFSEILIERPSHEDDSALLRHPVPREWIVDRCEYVGEGKSVLPPE